MVYKKIILCLLLVGCTSTKKLLEKKTKTDTVSTETGTVTSIRAGDTLTVTIPTLVYKDTTIYQRGKTTTLVQRYDNEGKLRVDCISDEINELKNYVKNAIEIKEEEEKSKEVERGFKDIYILYAFLGLGLLMFLNKKLK